MLKKLFPVVLIVALASPLVVAAPAQASPFGVGGKVVRLVKSLDLTDQQKDEIKAILKSHEATVAALLTGEKAARANLRAAIQQPTVNQTAVRQASTVVAKLDADLAVERARIYSEIYAVLTPTQRADLSAGIKDIQESVHDAVETIVATIRGLLS